LKSNKKFEISSIPELKKIQGIFQEARGLTFRTRKNARALLFEFNRPTNLKIHSCFVFFNFIAIWIDNSGKIIEKKIVRPWRISISPGRKFSKLIEIPINDFYRREIKELLRLD
jgi:uncharacterized membrane protein (UPF0127 family)